MEKTKTININDANALKKTNGFVVFAKRLLKNKSAIIGLVLFVVLVLLSLFSDYLTPYKFDEIDMSSRMLAPSAEHPFGTDQLGRDILTRVLYGGRYSLSLGLLSVGVAVVAAIILGTLSGFLGGWVDNLIMRIMDVIQSIPGTLIAIILSGILGSGYFTTIIALSVPCISGYTRVLRAQVMQIGENEYVEAATSLSLSRLRIMFKHILPNSWAPLLVSATMGIATNILASSALSFIGLGVQAPIPEWGAMLSAARDFMRDYPYMVIIPGLFIMVTVLSLNMFGDGVRDALDPKLKD